MTEDPLTWAWWEAALESPKDIGHKPHLLVHDEPMQGFYRSRFKGRQWEPVAIWMDGDQMVASRKGKMVDPGEIWTYACRNPITYEAYERAMAGGGWDDDDPTVAAALAKPGHNVGSTDEFETLQDEIASAEVGAEIYKGIASEEEAGRAQSLRARLNELAGKADKLREAAKAPHLKAGKDIDARWMPLVKSAKAIADMIRREIEAYQTVKLREQRRLEEERRQEELRRQAEEERLAKEIRAAEEAGRVPVVPPAPAPLPEVPVLVPDTIKGNYGRAATVGTELVVAEITDQGELYRAFYDHPDLKACLLNLAQRAVKAGQTVPGVRIEERAKIS